MTSVIRWTSLVVAASAVACSDPFGSQPSLSGRWVGGSTVTDLMLDLTPTQAKEGWVHGSGEATYTTWSFGEVMGSPTVRATGMHEHPHLSLTLELSSGRVWEVTAGSMVLIAGRARYAPVSANRS
jgi:hypothetical protein